MRNTSIIPIWIAMAAYFVLSAPLANAQDSPKPSTTARSSSPTFRCQDFMEKNPDLVCLPIDIARHTDLRIATLEHDLSLAKLASRRFSRNLGCGVGAALTINQTWDSRIVPAPLFCGLTFGFNLR